MTEADATALLERLDYVPGRDNTRDPRFAGHVDEIKRACRVLHEAELERLKPPPRKPREG